MNIFETYAKKSSFDLSLTMPTVKVKYRDQLCFKGKKIDYSDFTRFVIRDKGYLPFYTVKDLKEDDLVIDMYPLICIGAAELLGMKASKGSLALANFADDLLFEVRKATSVKKSLDFVKLVDGCNLLENEHEFEMLFSLRSDLITCASPTMKNLISALVYCYHTEPKVFCDAILEIMKFTYAVSGMFISKEFSVFEAHSDGISVRSKNNFSNLFPSGTTNTKKIGYTVSGNKTKHYITNCRGLGIYTFLTLFYSIYEDFGESNSSYIVNIKLGDENTHTYMQKQLYDCLGDDFVGKYYKTGKAKVRSSYKDSAYPIIYECALPVNSNILYTLKDGTKVSRDVYENDMLWRRANKVSFQKVDSSFIRNTSTYYQTIEDLEGYASICALGSSDEEFESQTNFKKELKAYDIRCSERIEFLNKKHTDDINCLTEGHKKDCEVYEQKIKELNAIIASKSNIIDQLTSELKEHRDYIRGYYSDENIVEEESTNVSIEDAVEYINQFKVTMVGGRDDLLQKLNELGCTGVVQVSSENALNSTPITSDFFCINTKFLSHKVAYNVESRYKDQKSQMFYYNGTNVKVLVKACYDFITDWMEA